VTADVATCIEDAVRHTRFPAQPEPASYEIPFTD
jgi:hypothetical protein